MDQAYPPRASGSRGSLHHNLFQLDLVIILARDDSAQLAKLAEQPVDVGQHHVGFVYLAQDRGAALCRIQVDDLLDKRCRNASGYLRMGVTRAISFTSCLATEPGPGRLPARSPLGADRGRDRGQPKDSDSRP